MIKKLLAYIISNIWKMGRYAYFAFFTKQMERKEHPKMTTQPKITSTISKTKQTDQNKSKKVKTIDFKEINEILDEISSVISGSGSATVSVERLRRIQEAQTKIANQIVEIAKEHFSEAFMTSYDPKGQMKCFNIHNVRGITIAYIWINKDNTPHIVPCERNHHLMMN